MKTNKKELKEANDAHNFSDTVEKSFQRLGGA